MPANQITTVCILFLLNGIIKTQYNHFFTLNRLLDIGFTL